jgi:multiple sugar transport system ATP-binding protein
MARIQIDHVRKTYGPVRVLKDFSLDIADGEFVVFVGPSGCGKSTMLKILAGLEAASSGQIWIGDREVTDLAPGDRDIAMVFQSYALYPHLTVGRNMGFGLKMRGMAAPEVTKRVQEAAKILGIEHLLDRRPKALSGGQRQRVALGRAIVREPLAFLMDEPLSNLDAKLRVHMRAEIGALRQRLGVTTIYVTHDQVEAMTMADRIVIMRDGEIQQIADPDTMFAKPANLFVASFIGSPGMNFLKSPLFAEGQGVQVELFGQRVRLSLSAAAMARQAGRPVVLGLRPEHLGGGPGPVEFDVQARLVESLGSEKYVFVDVPPANRIARSPGGGAEEERRGDSIVARLIESGPVAAGSTIRLSFDPSRLHVFDAESGNVIV